MCCGCYAEAGAPKIDNDNVRRLAALKPNIYEFGSLHVIVDDWNLDDSHIKFCRAEVDKDRESSPIAKRREHEFLDLIEQMTSAERYSAFAIAEGCWVP
jgi:hypothetical protein